jgi:hypothetical protein
MEDRYSAWGPDQIVLRLAIGYVLNPRDWDREQDQIRNQPR